jgi:restriction endonuclease S subunit
LLPAIIKLSISKKVLMGQTFNSSSLANLYIPLPPTNEQNTIVEKVELLMDKCSQLSKEIESLNIKGKNLLKAMFNETFETKMVVAE